jgi:phosphoglycolate phosphatase-like HAD superfamily hydrolase
MSALFGPAGNGDAFSAKYKSSVDAPGYLRELGVDLYEYQCGRGVNVGEATARKIVYHFFPHGEFTAAFGRVPERPLKPHVDAAKPIMDTLHLTPEEIAYVGDSNTDILFAKAVGMLPVATPWGYRSREELVEAGAELIAENPMDLLNLL